MNSSGNRIALVTGANRGIGLETCRQLKSRGFDVILSARNEDHGAEVAAETGVEFLPMDVSDENSISAAADDFRSRFGDRLDVLVNNAGIFPDESDSILEVDQDRLIHTLMTNTLGPLLVARAFRHFLENALNGGRIVNLSSGLGQLHDMEHTAPTYSISKTALNAVTRQLSSALREKEICVNSVCPGWVRTDMGGDNANRSVEEGADTVVWLADKAPADITGNFLRDRSEIRW
ncbi:MAG: SDR family NAD(P)-dependent oxidoreductase [Verrucomicrobiales bacterium]|nr:SDR family NAD(P)-dependent oxidoreductase [Verrucomicrobiales bacterium]